MEGAARAELVSEAITTARPGFWPIALKIAQQYPHHERIQDSRGFRTLKVWLALKQVGAAEYRRMIADDIALAQAMAGAVDRHPELELVT